MPTLESDCYSGYTITQPDRGKFLASFQVAPDSGASPRVFSEAQLELRIEQLKEIKVYADVSVCALQDLRSAKAEFKTQQAMLAMAFLDLPPQPGQ